MHSKSIRLGLVVALALCLSFPVAAFGATSSGSTASASSLTTQGANIAAQAENPFGQWQTVNGRTMVRCTWYAWKQVYERLGVELPMWGNGGDWYGAASANPNYSVGQTPEVGSVACWSVENTPEWGHVAYVTAVNQDGSFDLTEGGSSWQQADGQGICNRTVYPGAYWPDQGFIYIIQDNPMTATASDKSLKASAVKDAAKAVSPFKAEGAVGTVTFTDTSKLKYVTVGSDGKATVKKGTPAGTYTVKAHVVAAGDSRYRKGEADVEAKVQVVSPPAAPSILGLKVKALAAGFSASWKKSSRAQGYEVGYYTAKQKSAGRSIADAGSSTSKKVTGLKAQTAYSVEVRAYASAVDGKKYYSGWSGPHIVKTKKNSYTVSFVANGGKGAMKAQTVNRGKSVKLKANKFTRSGYKFAGWNTKKNGKGKSYANKAAVKNLAKVGKTVKLYAQWEKTGSKVKLYVVAKAAATYGTTTYTYNGNGLLKKQNADAIYTFGYSGKHLTSFKTESTGTRHSKGALSYDSKGRLSKVVSNGSHDSNTYIWRYTYNSAGKVAKLSSSYGSYAIKNGLYTTTAYDYKNGRVSAARTSSRINAYSYDGKGNLTKVIYTSNDGTYTSERTYTNIYNKAGRLVKRGVTYSSTTTNSVTYSYKAISVPKAYAALVKQQQRDLLNNDAPTFTLPPIM